MTDQETLVATLSDMSRKLDEVKAEQGEQRVAIATLHANQTEIKGQLVPVVLAVLGGDGRAPLLARMEDSERSLEALRRTVGPYRNPSTGTSGTMPAVVPSFSSGPHRGGPHRGGSADASGAFNAASDNRIDPMFWRMLIAVVVTAITTIGGMYAAFSQMVGK